MLRVSASVNIREKTNQIEDERNFIDRKNVRNEKVAGAGAEDGGGDGDDDDDDYD